MHSLASRHRPCSWIGPAATFDPSSASRWPRSIRHTLSPLVELPFTRSQGNTYYAFMTGELRCQAPPTEKTGGSVFMPKNRGTGGRIGDVARFACRRSLANFFGLTPSSRSSGEKAIALRQQVRRNLARSPDDLGSSAPAAPGGSCGG
jgi:hypothetical protein